MNTQQKILSLKVYFFCGPKLQTLHNEIFCGPKLQTLHGAIFVAKIKPSNDTQLPKSPYTKETY